MNKVELQGILGGAWKIEATKRIKEYLQRELANYQYVTIIS